MNGLTQRQIEVLQQAADGMDRIQSARQTHHSVDSIKEHRKKICQKLGAANITHAVAIAMREGIIS